jgi:23S rRNA (cytosine1962-C5)-methyltransferase
MRAIRLKPGREKAVRNRHPWIFSGAIASVQGSPAPAEIVEVLDSTGQFLARGYYNPRSQITVRLLTWEAEEMIDRPFWQRRLQASLARRPNTAASTENNAYRLVFAESDGIPGLIVDRYGDWLVLQILTLGLEPWRATLVDLLGEMIGPRGIYERSDVDVRAQEGIKSVAGALAGEAPPQRITILEHGLRFEVDVLHGHKTGFYLDQRENRQKIAAYCSGREVLNVFSYSGAFAVYAAAHGATRVTNLDSSADALHMAADNLRRNGFAVQEDALVEGDAFQVLRHFRDEGQRYDLVILDPPKFAFSQAQVQAATRGYKDINMLGMRLLRPGGILCTFSCSGLVSADLFQKVLFGASVDVAREGRILEYLTQSSDHPVLLTFPGSAYLKGFICHIA